MRKIKILFNRIASGSFKRMFRNARIISQETNIPAVFIVFDMIFCILFLGVGYLDYRIFGFAKKPLKIRKTYVTYNENVAICDLLNSKDQYYLLNNKIEFNKKYKDYIGRKFFNPEESSKEEFRIFCGKYKKLFIKPNDSFGGLGVYKKIDIKKDDDIDKLYDYLKENKLFIEERIEQHPLMSSLHPSSINTVRIVTVVINKKPHFVYAVLRIGKDDMEVDNSTSGGLNTRLSDDGEILKAVFCDKTAEYFKIHPTTGINLVGFKVPMFQEAKELCLKAAMVTVELGYIGWDIAITKNGPVIVEANDLPGYDMPQNFGTSISDVGLLPEFERLLNQKIKL